MCAPSLRLQRRALFIGLIAPALVVVASMWRMRDFTIDDAYISYRYARNFARGLGLVYNAGEHVEGYTNFLFTLALGFGIKLGVDPDKFAKVLGGAAALGSLGLTYRLSGELRPFRKVPYLAPWLLASTVVFTGYAVFGLETQVFVFLLLAGTSLLFREEEVFSGASARPTKIPYSGLVFALASLTRPEGPAFFGILVLFLGKRMFARGNLVRVTLFAAPVVLHLLWRHDYYGAWLPNTLGAKTGNLGEQVQLGLRYARGYEQRAGAVLWLALLGAAIGVAKRQRALLAIAALALFTLAYVCLVGGDWMPMFRFMAPFEPFCFLLVDVAVRRMAEKGDRAQRLALAAFGLFTLLQRGDSLWTAKKLFLDKEKRAWDSAAGGAANWFLANKRGTIALGDIGEIGYKTDAPILDLLGLVDPVIAKLPGGYRYKLGAGFTDRLFEQQPDYVLLISKRPECDQPAVVGAMVIYDDPRFLVHYEVGGRVPQEGGATWCIFRKKSKP